MGGVKVCVCVEGGGRGVGGGQRAQQLRGR